MIQTPETDRDRLLVMHVVFSFAVGGLENGVVNLINRMDPRRFRHVVVALTTCDPAFCTRVTRPDVEFISLHKPPGHGFKLFPALYRLFRQYTPDVVHTRNLAALEASFPAWLARVPGRVHGEHGWDVTDPDGTNPKYQLIRKLYRPFVGHYIALSGHLAVYLTDRIGVPGADLTRICNGVDVARFLVRGEGRAPIAGSPFNETPDVWVIGTVGRLQAVKDQLNLVAAFAAFRKRDPLIAARARLVLVGDGPLRGKIEQLIAQEGLQDVIWLAGERSDVASVMQGLDCFVLPSEAEGISNTILEAMASGLPVIATRVGGSPELVEDGVTGWLVPAKHPAALAEKLAVYAADPILARTHGLAGRARVEASFSLDGMVERYAGVYRRMAPREH